MERQAVPLCVVVSRKGHDMSCPYGKADSFDNASASSRALAASG